MLALCEQNTEKCNRLMLGSDTNLTFLRKAKTRKLTQEDENRIGLIYRNLTKRGVDALSELQTKTACPIAGECNFFNQQEDFFSSWAMDIQKSNITGIRPIGKPSGNGFIREIQLTKEFHDGVQAANYDNHVILKSNLEKDSDNLFYEWVVGLYLNGLMDRFPIFCKTYGLYEYRSEEDKALMLERPESGLAVIKRLNVVTEATGIVKSIQNPELLCVVVQHVHKSVALFDLLEEYNLLNQTLLDVSLLDIANVNKLSKLLRRNETEVTLLLPALNTKPLKKRIAEMLLLKREIVCALYQIYFVLDLMPGFSHNDLHVGNVILTPAGENKHYEFYYNNQSFHCKYAVKLIDYGRCSFTGSQSIKDKLEVFLREQVRGLSEEDVSTQIEYIERKNGFPWQYVGTTECSSLDFRLLNTSIEYGVLQEGVLRDGVNAKGNPAKFSDDSNAFYGKLDTASLPPNYADGPCNDLTKTYLNKNPIHKSRHKKYIEDNVYPTIRSVAPALYTEIEPHIFENSQCFCRIYVSDTEKLRIEWPTISSKPVIPSIPAIPSKPSKSFMSFMPFMAAKPVTAMAAGKTKKRRKTRSRTKIY